MENKGIMQGSFGIAASTDQNLLVRHSQSCVKTVTKAKSNGDYNKTCWDGLSQQWGGMDRLDLEVGGLSCRKKVDFCFSLP